MQEEGADEYQGEEEEEEQEEEERRKRRRRKRRRKEGPKARHDAHIDIH